MELRGQDKEIGMPSTLSYNNQPNRESSTKLSSPTLVSTVGERRRDHQTGHGNTILNPPQTLDQHLLYHHQQPNPNPHPHQNTQKPRRDPDSNPNPDPVPAPTSASDTVITPITTGSTIKPPSQPQPQPHTQTQTQPTTSTVRYRECLKNHAATMGGHVVDGCGEFMPSGEEGTQEALKCAACECHRNFHRKEIEGESQYVSNCYYSHNPNRNSSRRETVPPQHSHPLPLPLPPQPHHLHHQYHKFPHGLSTSPTAGHIAPMMMAFGSGGGAPAESSSEDLNMYQSNVGVQTSAQAPQSKKRFRTKFTQEQKDKMMELAEKLGWKIQKHDEQQVQQFCSEVGVKKQVFKVWMHNNKQAIKKKQM